MKLTQKPSTKALQTSARWKRLTSIALCGAIATPLLVGCKRNETQSALLVDASCVGSWLGSFIEAIPLPGFSVLGKLGKVVATGAASSLKAHAAGEVKDTCAGPATFSDAQMQQMKSAIKEGFDDQNHMEAKALMTSIDRRYTDFVPDKDKYNQFTMNILHDIIKDAVEWWTKYEQSNSKIYNVQDFIIVSGLAMKGYQHQVREVALAAANDRTPNSAQQVRDYAEVMSRNAERARRQLEEVSNNDIEAVARSFWKDRGEKQTKKYYAGRIKNAHCYESAEGGPYDDSGNPGEQHPARTDKFLAGMRATKTLAELSDFARKNGTVCCMDGACGNRNIENRIALYIEETRKQVKQVMFYNDAAIMKYYNETLPLFVDVGQKIKDASDDAIFSLAADATPEGSSETTATETSEKREESVTQSTPDSSTSDQPSAFANCPDGSNGPGKGYGEIFSCDGTQCAKADTEYKNTCIIAPVEQASTDFLNCSGHGSCNSGWGWLGDGENGCSTTSPGWKDSGCSCTCG